MNKRAFTLVEIVISLTVSVAIFASISICAKGVLDRGKATRTIKDLDSIAIASQSFHKKNGSWPTQVSDLIPEFLSSDVSTNVFGNNFLIDSNANQVTISCTVPFNTINSPFLGPQLNIGPDPSGEYDRLQVTRPARVGINAKVQYDRIYLQ